MKLIPFSKDELPWHNCSLYLEHNPHYSSLVHNEHKSYYETVEQISEDRDWSWVSDEEKALAIQTDDVWVLQWYPDTPIGFYLIAAHNLDKLFEKAKEIENEYRIP